MQDSSASSSGVKGKVKYGLMIFTMVAVFAILAYGTDRTLRQGPKHIEVLKATQEEAKALLPLGTEAPNFILPGINGKDYHLHDYRGKKYVLVEIFASWCPHCQASVEALKSTYHKYGDRLEILSINAGDKPPRRSTSKEFQAAFGVTYPILEEPSDALLDSYKLEAYPTMYLVDKNGKIIFAHNGDLRPDEQKKLEALLK